MSDAGYILGISLGTNTVGWAAIALSDDAPASILAAGTRVFASDAALIAAGRDEPRNAKRRAARLARRQTARRALRLRKTFLALQQAGVLPAGVAETPWHRRMLLRELDEQISAARPPRDRVEGHLLPYLLRATALRERLQPHELGRALYHLAQRRGFKSNRKTAPQPSEEAGPVATAINELRNAMTDGGFPTLGAYFASLDPEEGRIRHRWTDRRMLEDELHAIWSAQAPLHPGLLTEELRKKLHRIIFRQRQMKTPRRMRCVLEPNSRRAAKALLISQRFRIVQAVVSLRVTSIRTGEERPLDDDERSKLVDALMVSASLSLSKARKLLGIGTSHRLRFGMDDDEKEILGNTTAAKMIDALGRAAWDAMSDAKRDTLVTELRQIQNDDVLERRAVNVHGLSPEAAKRYAAIELEQGWMRYSTRAMATRALPIDRGRAELRSAPTILRRSLAQLRRVVKAALRRWGSPASIRIELARDLKTSRKDRQLIDRERREVERQRQAAIEKLVAETGRLEPTAADIERVLLWEECGGVCTLTGRPISFSDLFTPAIRVEHVIPLSRSLDDSFTNKTLGHRDGTPERDLDRTPREIVGGTPHWDELVERAFRLKGRRVGSKAWMFMMTSEQVASRFADFQSRQLADTGHVSRVAADLLRSLHGGRVEATAGQATAMLRAKWGLEKTPADHRGHAVDAVVVALTSAPTIQALVDGAVAPPWPSFSADVADALARINVSHRPSRRLSGALHEETNYRRPRAPNLERESFIHRRVRVDALTTEQRERIVDKRIQAAVKAGQHFTIDKNGRKVPIHAVRVKDTVTTIRIGQPGAEREVMTGDNHHMAIVAIVDAEGREIRWEGSIVSLFEAQQRLNRRRAARRANQHPLPPIVDYGEGPGRRPKFTLREGDTVRLGGDIDALCVVRAVSDGNVNLYRAEDGRASHDRMRDGGIIRKTPDRLRELDCRKVEIDALGDEHPCND